MDWTHLINRGKFLVKKHVIRRGPRRIRQMLDTVPTGRRRVIFGSHWSNHEGWLALGEEDQDITRRLEFPDGSVDVVYTEHVIEHLPFLGTVGFFEEAFRILAPGGKIRTVCPIFEQVLAADFSRSDPRLDEYFRNSMLNGKYAAVDRRLRELGLPGITADRRLFFVNNLFTEHGHRFLWSTKFLGEVLQAVGFVGIRVGSPGEGADPDLCIERKRRGIYLGRDWREDGAGEVFDPESRTIEATKPGGRAS